MNIQLPYINKYNFLYVNKKSDKNTTMQCFSNLAPLKKDTVSFSGRAKLIGGDMKSAPSENMCRQISGNAEPARYFLESVLEKYIGEYVSHNDFDNSKDKPILSFTTRKKSSSSIREKVASKYSRITSDEVNKFVNQVVDELSKKFKMTSGTTRDVVIDDAKRIAKYSLSDEVKIPPYAHSDELFDEIISTYQSIGRFDFAAVPEKKRNKIFNDIKVRISGSEDSSHHINGRYIDPTTVKGVKHYANDIVGGRIIMRDQNPEYTAVILDGLKQAVQDKAIVITSIENNVVDPAKIPIGSCVESFSYAKKSQLKALAKAVDAPLIEKQSKSGYSGLHINFSLDSDILKKYNGVFDGFNGEIQIIGEDVLRLKSIEDLCYKLKDNKNVIHEDYKPFKDYFLKYYSSDDVKKAFDDYTYALYLSQRMLPRSNQQNYVFPSIKELGFEGKVPEELDFNELRKVKEYCDLKHRETLKAQDTDISSSKSKNSEMSMIKRNQDIATMKTLIKYRFNQ